MQTGANKVVESNPEMQSFDSGRVRRPSLRMTASGRFQNEMDWATRLEPQGLKPGLVSGFCGTTKVVP